MEGSVDRGLYGSKCLGGREGVPKYTRLFGAERAAIFRSKKDKVGETSGGRRPSSIAVVRKKAIKRKEKNSRRGHWFKPLWVIG